MKVIADIVFLVAVLLAVAIDIGEACLQSNEACQPDGSIGLCCSGFCYKQERWNYGLCANRTKRAVACLAKGLPCKYDGSRGNCCSGFCNLKDGTDWGTC